MTLKEILQKRGELQKQMRDLVDLAEKENRDLTTEENQQFDNMHADDMALKSRAERQQKLEASEQELRSPRTDERSLPPGSAVGGMPDDHRRERGNLNGPTEEERCQLFAAWCRRQSGIRLTEAQKKLCKRFRFDPSNKDLDCPVGSTSRFRQLQSQFRTRHQMRPDGIEFRDGVNLTSGASLVPQGFVNRLEVAMLTHGPMLVVSDILTTLSGNPLKWPMANDTANEGGIVGEATEVDADEDPTFSPLTLGAFKFTSKIVMVSTEIIQDAEIELVGFLADALGERLGRHMNRKFTVGEGTTEPRGILLDAAAGKTAALANAITAEELFDLFHSVDPAYRDAPGAAFMMNDALVLAVRKLKNDDQFLWRSGLEDGVPDRLLGKPVRINQHMPSVMEEDAKVMLFGDLTKYKVRLAGALRQRRLVERFADTDEEGFVGFQRADGGLANAGTGPVKVLQMAGGSD